MQPPVFEEDLDEAEPLEKPVEELKPVEEIDDVSKEQQPELEKVEFVDNHE